MPWLYSSPCFEQNCLITDKTGRVALFLFCFLNEHDCIWPSVWKWTLTESTVEFSVYLLYISEAFLSLSVFPPVAVCVTWSMTTSCVCRRVSVCEECDFVCAGRCWGLRRCCLWTGQTAFLILISSATTLIELFQLASAPSSCRTRADLLRSLCSTLSAQRAWNKILIRKTSYASKCLSAPLTFLGTCSGFHF